MYGLYLTYLWTSCTQVRFPTAQFISNKVLFQVSTNSIFCCNSWWHMFLYLSKDDISLTRPFSRSHWKVWKYVSSFHWSQQKNNVFLCITTCIKIHNLNRILFIFIQKCFHIFANSKLNHSNTKRRESSLILVCQCSGFIFAKAGQNHILLSRKCQLWSAN